MFADHQPIIAAYARENADNLARVLQFVILTVRQPLHSVPAATETVDQGGEEALGVLYGWKFAAYANVWAMKDEIFAYFQHAERHSEGDALACEILSYLCELPGFGPAKAGFVAQLVYGVAGCIDTHNLARFQIPSRRFDNYKQIKTAKSRQKRIKLYVETCAELGGCAKLWDGWCAYVAANQPKIYRDANHVSALHLEALGLEPKG